MDHGGHDTWSMVHVPWSLTSITKIFLLGGYER